MERLPGSIRQVVLSLRQGRLDPVELYTHSARRLKKLQHLNAVVTPTTETAQRQAEEARDRYQQGLPLGPLDGVPIAVKDNFSTCGVQTSCASRMLSGYKPPYTATVVQKLLDQGGVLMGKTNLDEFAMGCGTVDSIFGPTRNPWTYQREEVEPETGDFRICGGSSGGSAVSVATGIAYAALGSDTGGSVRNPASFCGVVGLKPTYGLLSRHGLIPLVNSLDVPGIFTRCIDDAATMLNLLAGSDVMDSTTVPRKHDDITIPDDVTVADLHIGIPAEYHAPGTSRDTIEAWTRVADMFENAGARVSMVTLPHTQYSLATYSVLCACEVASNMARYDGVEFGHRANTSESTDALYAASRHEGFNDVVRSRILAGNYFLLREQHRKYYAQALKMRRRIAQDFSNVFSSGVDLLLTPTVLGDAPWYSEFSQADNRTRTQEQDVFTQPVNIAGVPAVTVPAALSQNKLPIGLQLIAPNFHERTMLRAAKWMEQQVNFPPLDLSASE